MRLLKKSKMAAIFTKTFFSDMKKKYSNFEVFEWDYRINFCLFKKTKKFQKLPFPPLKQRCLCGRTLQKSYYFFALEKRPCVFLSYGYRLVLFQNNVHPLTRTRISSNFATLIYLCSSGTGIVDTK